MCDPRLLGTVSPVGRRTTTAAMLERGRRMPPLLLDAVLATVFVAVGFATTANPDPGYEPRDGLLVALVLVATVPYYARRLAPVPVFLVSLTAAVVLYVEDYDPGALSFVVLTGAYTVAAYRPPREVVLAAAYMYASFVMMLLSDSAAFGAAEFATSIPMFGTSLLLGWTTQARRLRAEALERDQGEAALRAAADERLRIAQELHDVIGHSLGVIAVQAGVGAHLIDTDPAEAKRALEHISRTSRASLSEVRQLLGLVRAGNGAASYAPTPGLADLPRLADDVTKSGLQVELAVAEDARDIPPGVELAAYRIVQEALTNVGKHAGASRATVHLTVDGGTLHVDVADDGDGPSPTKVDGHGLIGMRERVAVYGGVLDAGRGVDGGFRVHASLPYEGMS
jgi:signal transduction histidine kinase